MYIITEARKIRVKLGGNYTSYSEATTGFNINQGEEKEVAINAVIKEAIKNGVLVVVR